MRRIVILLSACSSPSASQDAATTDTPPVVDAAPPCDVTQPFATPSLLPGVNTVESDIWGWQTADEKELYFSRYVAPYTDGQLHMATRGAPSATFGNIAALDSVNTVFNERRPILTSDGLTLLAEATSNQADIRVATRPSTSDEFSTMTPFANINDDTRSDFNPWISPDALVLYFTSNRGGDHSIFKAVRSSPNGDFDMPVLVTELDSTFGDYMGSLSGDSLEIVFTSRRDTNGTNGDVFHATRPTPDAPFGPPAKLTELSDPTADDYATWLSPDRCQVLFTSNRPGIGAYDIWIAARP